MLGFSLLAVLLLCPGSLEEGVEARWRREYPAAVAKLEKTVRSCLVEGTYNFRYFNGDVSTVEGLKVACQGDKRVMIRDPRSYRSKGPPNPIVFPDVECMTPDYTFKLKRQSSGGPYVIEHYAMRTAGDDISFNADFYPGVNNATRYWDEPLSAQMKSPSFVVKAAHEVDEGAAKLVRIDYADDGPLSAQVGSVWLEPSRGWVIRRAEVVSTSHKNPGSITFKCEVRYRDLPDGSAFPDHMESSTRLSNDPEALQSAVLDLTRIELGEPPAAMFKLSGYGLPDIPLRPTPRESTFTLRNPWLWASLATAVVSFTLLWITRRRNRATVS